MTYWENQKSIKALYELCSRPVRMKYGLTQMEYSILLFLHRNPGCDTASSIVQTCQFTKSHVSSALKSLTNRKLITKEYAENNNKTIHLGLTDRAENILQESAHADRRYKELLFAGFSEEELLQIESFFDRICTNAKENLQITEEKINA